MKCKERNDCCAQKLRGKSGNGQKEPSKAGKTMMSWPRSRANKPAVDAGFLGLRIYPYVSHINFVRVNPVRIRVFFFLLLGVK